MTVLCVCVYEREYSCLVSKHTRSYGKAVHVHVNVCLHACVCFVLGC